MREISPAIFILWPQKDKLYSQDWCEFRSISSYLSFVQVFQVNTTTQYSFTVVGINSTGVSFVGDSTPPYVVLNQVGSESVAIFSVDVLIAMSCYFQRVDVTANGGLTILSISHEIQREFLSKIPSFCQEQM